MFNIVILNILWSLIASERFDYDDPKLKELVMLVNDLLSTAGPKPTMMIPFLRKRYLPDMVAKTQKIRRHLENSIEQHKISHDSNTTRDYIDAFLTKIQVCKKGENASALAH